RPLRTPRYGWTSRGRPDKALPVLSRTGQKGVERPGTRARDEEEDAAHDLRVLRSNLVQDSPDAHLRRHRGQGERRDAEEHLRLRGEHRYQHLDDERNRDEPRTEAEDQQDAPDDFQPPDERRRD